MKRRALRFEHFDQVIADIEHLHRVGYTRLGNWGLAEICDHCSAFADMSINGFPRMMPRVVRATIGSFVLRRVLYWGKIPRGMPSPKMMLPARPKAQSGNENSAVDEAPAVARCIAAMRKVQKTVTFAEHPLAGQIEPDLWHKTQLIHCAHHLSFLVPKAS